jgi:hypothetical protein
MCAAIVEILSGLIGTKVGIRKPDAAEDFKVQKTVGGYEKIVDKGSELGEPKAFVLDREDIVPVGILRINVPIHKS